MNSNEGGVRISSPKGFAEVSCELFIRCEAGNRGLGLRELIYRLYILFGIKPFLKQE